MPFKPTQPPLTRGAALKLSSSTDVAAVDCLATIWDEVVHRIIERMLAIGGEPAPLHIDLRSEMIFELAKLQLWLGERVVERRLSNRDRAQIDPVRERGECLGPEGEASIASTARLAYDHIWSRLIEERWKPKSARALERETKPRPAKLAVKPVGKNHFIPRWFIRDHWSTNGKVLRWRRGADGWTSRRRGFGEWGFRHNLYSDHLEAYFGLLEGDAKKPIDLLLKTIPLNDTQRTALVGFLIVQLLRNPYLIERMERDLQPVIDELGYGEDPDMARKAYEQLYRNNDLYHQLAHPVLWSGWAIVESETPLFVLPDTFGARADLGDGLRLIVPITPYKCFVALPGRESEKRIVPHHLKADEELAQRISSALVEASASEFLSHPNSKPTGKGGAETLAELLTEIEAAIDRASAVSDVG